jgi:hypothetical protein
MGGKDAKIMLWAHNGHVRKKGHFAIFKSQGECLTEMYGDELYTIGFDYAEGSFCAWCVGNFSEWTAEAPRKGSLGQIFQSVPHDQFFIDFHVARDDPAMAKFLHKKLYQRSAGAFYHPDFPQQFYVHEKPAELYDGMIFLKSTHMARNLKGEDQYVAALRQNIKGKIAPNAPIRLTAKVKLAPVSPGCMALLWFADRNGRISYSTGTLTQSDTLRNREWQTVTLNGTRGQFDKFDIGVTLRGNGSLRLDDLKLEYKVDGQWVEYPLENPGFEEGKVESALKPWVLFNEVFTSKIISSDAAMGKRCLEVAWKGPRDHGE